MALSQEPLSLVDPSGYGYRVSFLRTGDRYIHRVHGIRDEVLLESVDGDEDDFWPPSPPLQHCERHGNDALLTGLAGTSYWSVSVSLIELETLSGKYHKLLVFDAACRLKELPGFLGSTYRLCSAQVKRQKGRAVCLSSDTSGLRYLLDSSRCKALEGSDIISIRLPQTRPEAFPTTARWKYSLSAATD